MWTLITTKLGPIYAKLTDGTHVYCSTYPRGTNVDFGEEAAAPLTLRGKTHHVTCHVFLGTERTPQETWNDIYFAGMNTPTRFQKETIHQEIQDAVRKYCAEHPELVVAAERRDQQRQVETLEQKLFDLEREAQEVRNQLEIARIPLRAWQLTLPDPTPNESPMDWLWCQEHLGDSSLSLSDCVHWNSNPHGDCGGRLMADGNDVVCETCFNRRWSKRD